MRNNYVAHWLFSLSPLPPSSHPHPLPCPATLTTTHTHTHTHIVTLSHLPTSLAFALAFLISLLLLSLLSSGPLSEAQLPAPEMCGRLFVTFRTNDYALLTQEKINQPLRWCINRLGLLPSRKMSSTHRLYLSQMLRICSFFFFLFPFKWFLQYRLALKLPPWLLWLFSNVIY